MSAASCMPRMQELCFWTETEDNRGQKDMENGIRRIWALVCIIAMLFAVCTAKAEEGTDVPAAETVQETGTETVESAEEAPAPDEEAGMPDQAETTDKDPEKTDTNGDGKKEEDPPKTWGQEAVEKFGETPLRGWIVFITLLITGAVLLVVTKTRKQWTTKTIAYAALSIALAFVLSCIRLFRMPNGGSVTPASMLPILLFSAAFGIGPGLLTGMAYGVLQCIQGGGVAAAGGFAQFALDYLLAFTVLGLAGLTKYIKNDWGLYAAMAIAIIGRLICHTLAGVLFWNTELWASFVYNISYIGPELVICMILAAAIAKPVMKIMKA